MVETTTYLISLILKNKNILVLQYHLKPPPTSKIIRDVKLQSATTAQSPGDLISQAECSLENSVNYKTISL